MWALQLYFMTFLYTNYPRLGFVLGFTTLMPCATTSLVLIAKIVQEIAPCSAGNCVIFLRVRHNEWSSELPQFSTPTYSNSYYFSDLRVICQWNQWTIDACFYSAYLHCSSKLQTLNNSVDTGDNECFCFYPSFLCSEIYAPS